MGPSRLEVLLFSAAFSVLATPCSAQSWTVFNMDNSGLPSNTITALVQDGQGVVWVATDWGLCRYDGLSWTIFQQGNSDLPDNSVRCLAVDDDDRLWVGTMAGGIAILDAGIWTILDVSNSALVDNEIAGITHDHRGWAWISTPAGLYCWTGQEWHWYNDTAESHDGHQLFGPNMSATAVREDGLVAIATRNAGLTYISEEDFIFYTTANSNFPDNSANGVALDAMGDRWLACPAGGLIRHAGPHVGGQWFQYNAFTSGFPDNTLTCIVIDDTDRKLAGTETAGVLVFNGPGDWYTLDPANSGLPEERVLSLLCDASGSLWAGTMSMGLARLDAFTGLAEGHRTMPAPYPNPSTGAFQVDLADHPGKQQWMLLDLAGRVVDEGELQGGALVHLSVDVKASGTYVFRSRSSQGVLSWQIFIQ